MNGRVEGILARLGIRQERQLNSDDGFLVDRGGAYGQIKVKVRGDDGQMVSLERPKAGGEIRVEYRPGLTCLYRYDGTLKRIYCRFCQYLAGLESEMKKDLLPAFAELVSYLGGKKRELVLYADISGGFFRIMCEDEVQTWRNSQHGLESVMGDLYGANMQLGEGRPPIEVNYILSQEGDLYYVGVGAAGVIIGSPVREFIDIELLKGEVTENVARRMITAGKQIRVSFVS